MDRATLDKLEVQERMHEIAMQISHIEEDNSDYFVEDDDIDLETLQKDDDADVTPHAIELQNITPENNSILNNATISRLVSELHTRNVEFNALEMRSNHVELQVSALMSREREQREQIATLEYQQAVAEEHIMLLESKLATISEFEQSTSNGEISLDSLRGRLLSAANARIAELETEAKQLRHEHENGLLELDHCRVHLQAKLQATEKELKECTKQLAQRTVLYAAQERRFLEYQRTSQSTISEDKYALVTCQAKLDQVTTQLKQANEEKVQSSLRIRDLESTVATLTEKISLSDAKILELEDELNAAMSVNHELQSTVSRLKGSDVEELERQMADEVEGIRSASHREIEALRHQLEQAQKVIQEESAIRDHLEETLRDLDSSKRSQAQINLSKDEENRIEPSDVGASGGYSELLWDENSVASSSHNGHDNQETVLLDKLCDLLDSISRWMSTAAMEAESDGENVSMEHIVHLGVAKYFGIDSLDVTFAAHATRIQCHLLAVLSFMDCCRNPDAAPLRSGLMEDYLIGDEQSKVIESDDVISLKQKVKSLENELLERQRTSTALMPRQDLLDGLEENLKEKERVIQAVLHEASLLREHRDVLLSQLESANRSVEQLQKELDSLQTSNECNDDLNKQIESLQVCLQREEQERIRLRTRLDELITETDEAKQAKEDAVLELEEVNRRYDELAAERDRLVSSHQQESLALIDKFKTQINTLVTNLDDVKEKIQWYDARHATDTELLEKLKSDAEKNFVHIASLVQDKKDMESSYKTLEEEVKMLRQESNENEKRVQQLKLELRESLEDVRSLTERCQEYAVNDVNEGVIHDLRKELENEKAKCASLVESAEKATVVIRKLKTENMQAAQEHYSKQLKAYEDEIEALKVENRLLTNKIENMQADAADERTTSQIEGMRRANDVMEKQIVELKSEISTLRKDKIELTDKYTIAHAEIAELVQQQCDSEDRTQHLEVQCRNLRDDLRKAREEAQSLAEKVNTASANLTDVTVIEEMRRSLEAESARCASLVESAEKAAAVIRKMKVDNAQLNSKVTEATKQLDSYRDNVAALKSENTSLKEKIEFVVAQNEKLQKQILAHRENAVNQATTISNLREQIKQLDIEIAQREEKAAHVIQEMKAHIQSLEHEASIHARRRHNEAESDSDDSLCRYSSKHSQHEAVINDLQLQVTSLQLEKHQCEQTNSVLREKLTFATKEVESTNALWAEKLVAVEEDAKRTRMDIEATERVHLQELERIHRKLQAALSIHERSAHSSGRTSILRESFANGKSEQHIDELISALENADSEIARLKSQHMEATEKWEMHIAQIKRAVKEKYQTKLSHAKQRFSSELNSVVSMIQEECRAIYEEAEALAEKHQQELVESRKKALFPEMLSPEETQLLVQKILLRSTDAAALSTKSSVVSSLQQSHDVVGASVLRESRDKSVVTPGRATLPNLQATQSPDLQARQSSRAAPRESENDSADLTNRVRGLLAKLQNIPS